MGRPLLRLEFFNVDNPYAMELRSFTQGEDYRSYNGGMYLMTKTRTPFCVEYHLAAQMRLFLETPFLSGRIDNVRFTYTAQTRKSDPAETYFYSATVGRPTGQRAVSSMSVTVLVPIGPYHVNVAHRAIASVHAQTALCTLATYRDDHGRGPGYGRNHLLQSVNTEFVVFLDADDWLEPTFVEKALRAFDGRRYIYTDWFQDGNVITAPTQAWCQGKPHLITTLLPTKWLQQIGGFDTSLPGMEDTDLIERLMEYGYCGKRLEEPLLHYSGDGKRSKEFRQRKDYEEVKRRIRIRHKTMGCCGDTPVKLEDAPGEVVEAKALWGGNRREVGRITGYVYPRTGNGHTIKVNRRDALASPHLWQIVVPPAPPPPDDHTALDVIGGAMFPKRPARARCI